MADDWTVASTQADPAASNWTVASERPDSIQIGGAKLPLAPMPQPAALAGNPDQPSPFVSSAPIYGGMNAAPQIPFDVKAVAKGTGKNVGDFLGATGPLVQGNPEFGGTPGAPPPTAQQIQTFTKASATPLVPLSAGAQPGTLLHGITSGVEQVTSPQNAAIVAATAGTSAIPAAALRGLHTVLGGYFTLKMAQGAGQNVVDAYQAYQRGDLDAVAEKLGAGTTEGLMALAGARATGTGIRARVSEFDRALDEHNENAAAAVFADAGQHQGEAPPLEPRVQPAGAPVGKQPVGARAVPPTPAPPAAAPELADLPTPQQAVANATQRAQATVDGLESVGQQIEAAQAEAASPWQPVAERPEQQGATPNDNRPDVPVERSGERTQGQSEPHEQASSQQEEASAPQQQPVGQPAGEPEPGSEQGQKQEPAQELQLAPRLPATPPAYGAAADVRVPGEDTVYPARYAVRELSDVQASHNPVTFQANPQYEYENDRDYSNPQNAARVVEYGSNGNYQPDYVLTKSPTAELGAPIIDQRGNVLGGNNRTMTLGRVYGNNPTGADDYRQQLAKSAQEFGVAPEDLARFKNPILTRELTEPITNGTAQRAITDFNKSGVGSLTPGEQAVTDGRRMSAATVQHISGNLADVGEDSTLAQAMQGDRGQEIMQSLVKDGVVTEQEKNGYLDERGFLTPDAKQRIAKALVGRLFDTPADFNRTAPDVRNKLERIVPQVLRVEDRPAWNLTQPVREGIAAIADARAHGIRPDDLANQPDLEGRLASHSPQALAIAQTLALGPLKTAHAFRQYANDAALSREGAPSTFFEPPTQKEAFRSAFNSASQKPIEMQASRETTPPALTDQSRTQPHVTGAPTSFHGRLANVERIPLSPENAQRADAYVANAHAVELISRAAGRPPDDAVGIGALHLNPQSAAQLAPRLVEIRNRNEPSARAPGLLRLITAVQKAADAGKSLIIVKDAPGFDPALRLTGLNEELGHAAQRDTGGGENPGREHLRGSAEPFKSGALGQIAYRRLQKTGYTFSRGPGEVAAEIGVRLMVPDRYAELDLNLQQARTLGAQYVRALRKEYGHARSTEIAGRVFDALRRTDRRSQSQSPALSGRPGPERGSGPPSGIGENTPAAIRPPPSPAGSELPGQLHASQSSLEGIAPDQGALFSRKPGEAPPSQSLFSPDESKDVAATAARDRDQLQRQRLTAQLNAPLTRDEQLAKLKRSKEQPQTDFFEDTTPDQGMLFSIPKRADEDPAKLNYSGLGALESKAVRNLGQLRRASEPAFNAAVRAASSRSQASVVMKTAMPKLVEALGKNIPKEDFFRALIQSRLTGIQQRWQQMGDFAQRASEANLEKSLPNVLGVLDHLEDRAGFGRDLPETAASLAEKKDYGTLRQFLGDTFGRAAQNVATVMSPDEFSALRQLPEFQRGLETYKNLVEQPMAESHELNEGIFSTALGPLDTYYPLVPVDKTEHGPQAQLADRQKYAKPKNVNNNFATGLADDYEASTDALRQSLTRAIHTNNKANLMDALEEHGVVKALSPFERPGDRILYNGQELAAVVRETSPGRQVIQNGKSTFIPPKRYLVPRAFDEELDPILTRQDKLTPSLVKRLMNAANTIAISGPADFVYHSSNLFGALVANTPFLGNSLVGKAASVPVLKRFAGIVKVLATDPTTEESAADLQDMAKLGILPDRFGTETYSKKYAEMTGAKLHRLSAGPMLYGPKGIDVRARLVMYRLAKEINPQASGPQLHLFVNQLGTYVDALQSAIVRGARKSGLAPFAEAGSTMVRNGINAWTGTGPMPKSGIGLRLWQQLTGGGIGLVALWALAYKAYTGKYPWQDKRAKLLQIPANPQDRASKLGRMLWGKGSEPGYLNFAFFNPLVGRGGRALGIKGAADTAHEGGKWWQDLETAQKDMMNAYAHPFLGPLPRAAFVGLTGSEPYLTGLRDDRARLAPQLMPSVRGGAGSSVAKRAAAGAAELNSFYGNVGASLGGFKDNPRDTSNRWTRMVFDLATPGLVGQAQNPAEQRARTLQQAAVAKRAR